MRRSHILILALALGSILPEVSAKYLFSTNFNSGRIPAVMSVTDEDGTWGDDADYREGNTSQGWTATMVSGAQYAAVSPSHTRSDVRQSNLLTTPAVTLSGLRPMLRWRSRSIHPDFPEAYSILLSEVETGAQTLLFHTDSAPTVWQTHALDLSPWLGKQVKITFRCESVNRYLLAIDDIQIGDPEEANWQASVTTPSFVGLGDTPEGTAPVSGYIENMGLPVADAAIICLADGLEVGRRPIEGQWSCGERVDFTFDLPVRLESTTPYEIAVIANDTPAKVLSNSVRASHFPRTLLLDEFTGLWCNNCPRGILEVENLQARFGSQIIPLAVHISDPLQCDDYRNAFSVHAIPHMMLNRNPESGDTDSSKFAVELTAPTVAEISLADPQISDRQLSVKACVQMAYNTDNSSDRYRIGYVLTRLVATDLPDVTLRQVNAMTTVASDRFYYLPSKVVSDLHPNHNVVSSSVDAISGRPASLPSEIPAYTPVESVLQLDLPDCITDLKDAALVAYVVDSQMGLILNSTRTPLDRTSALVNTVPLADHPAAAPEYYSITGQRILNPSAGLFIVRRGNHIAKEILK